ncbi:MAG: hypothetical protein FI729_01285 [SAR202 cluster bacterium]|nr:hypothetical protein [SAR202 cluster bacterium]|tara:strand:- start:11586 stop:13307 length:1722 start_codon:yes stop_codon:yes gene_type:complete
MPIRVRYKNDPSQECNIRPTPFVQISTNTLKNKQGNFGVTYSITLTGTLLPDEGSPLALDPQTDLPYAYLKPGSVVGSNELTGPYGLFDKTPLSAQSRPPRQQVKNRFASALLSKQRALRALFAQDGQRIEITDIYDQVGATLYCNPRVTSISFTEGNYVNKCEYTINLEADVLLRGTGPDSYMDAESTLAGSGDLTTTFELSDFLEDPGSAFLESFDENWGLEVDDQQGQSVDHPRSYRISHSINATGKTFYKEDGKLSKPAWQQARDFVLRKLSSNPSGNYPNVAGIIGSGTINLVKSYRGYNHVRTEQVNETAGTYSVTENWLLSSGLANENYSMSTSTSNTDPFVNVNIDGTITGMSEISPSGFDNSIVTAASGAYTNALRKYNEISNSGKFGISSDIYKRANNLVAVQLNSQPVSISLGTNQYNGQITYSLGFNNRPTNIISGVIAESIQVDDTYPGDIFAVIPVLGRKTGPVLQYIGGRSEYSRNISINLTMDYTKIPYGSERDTLLLKKPSVVEPTATQIADLLKELSPQGEPGIRKYFISPPSESWNPKEGTYSFNISFTYELDR